MKLRTGGLNPVDKQKLTEAASRLMGRKLQIIDRSAINANFIRSVCRKIRKQQGLDMIVVDYLQLMSPIGKHGSRENEVSSISGSLKAIAKEFNVPLIALSQLSRKTEERPDKRPQLADLRDSGSIEQDADIVLGLYRGSYYYSGSPEKDAPDIVDQLNGMGAADRWEQCSSIEFLKHRNGAVGSTILELFEGQFSRFSPMEASSMVAGNENTNLPF